MKTVSIVGGSGFIGTALGRILAREKIDFEIIDLKRSNSFPQHTKIGDARIKDDMLKCIEGDIIVNLAAVHRDDISNPSEYYATNVDGTKNICETAIEKGISHIVFASSVAVYGFAPVGTDEQGSINPFNDYGRSKAQAELVLTEWQSSYSSSRRLTIVRPTVVFGEGNRGNVHSLFEKVASGSFVMIGTGVNKKSIAYVENVASFLMHAIRNPTPMEIINYVDEPDFDMNTLVSQIRGKLFNKPGVGLRIPYFLGLTIGYFADAAAKITGRNFPISAIRVRKFCADTSFSSNKTKFFDFVPTYSIQEGLDRTLEAEFISPPDPTREIFYTE